MPVMLRVGRVLIEMSFSGVSQCQDASCLGLSLGIGRKS